MSARQTIVWIGLAICLGCVPHTDPPAAPAPAIPAAAAAPAATTPPVAQAPPAQAPPAGAVAITPPQAEPASQPAVNSPAPAPADPVASTQPPVESPAEKPGERVVAKAGVGKKGQSLKNETGMMVEPAKAYFRVEQRIIFDDVIPKNMSLFEATEGRKPKSHEEFMSKIIEANQVKLPTLPPGDKYVYDPERGELMVEKKPK